MAQRSKILVIFGGRSGEHEISLRSAASVIRELDPAAFEIIPLGIAKNGQWLLHSLTALRAAPDSGNVLTLLPEHPDTREVTLAPHPQSAGPRLIPISGGAPIAFDVAFPVIHGPMCEDGTIQGLFELADIPYVGCGVLASSVAMDKDLAKRVVKEAGVPVVPSVTLKHAQWKKSPDPTAQLIEKTLGYPVFVKPANLGSSVGVHKVKTPGDLGRALDDAFRYDTKVLVEKAINAREIELAVLEDVDSSRDPLVSQPGEITPTHEFYSYEAKYLDDQGAALQIPAKLSSEQMREAQSIASRAFQAIEGEGLARVDLFVDRDTGKFYFNEANTIPGFTSISMYPKMMEASGVGYTELLTRLIRVAQRRHRERSALVREFHGG